MQKNPLPYTYPSIKTKYETPIQHPTNTKEKEPGAGVSFVTKLWNDLDSPILKHCIQYTKWLIFCLVTLLRTLIDSGS